MHTSILGYAGDGDEFRDTLRRHWKSCVARKSTGISIPEHQQPGRKKQACDNCADVKQACDGSYPCQRCLLKGLTCSVSRLLRYLSGLPSRDIAAADTQFSDDPSRAGWDLFRDTESEFAMPDPVSWGADNTFSMTSVEIDDPSTNQVQLFYAANFEASVLVLDSFDFLWHFTTCSGLNNSFNYLTSRDCRQSGLSSEKTPESLNSFTTMTNSNLLIDNNHVHSMPGTMKWIFHPLFPRAKEILEALCCNSLEKHNRRVPSIQDMFDEKCIEFFNPINIERFLDLYWTRWHPNCPILHRFSFNITKIPMELLLVMALTGALMSSQSQDLMDARLWLDATEQLVFRSPWLSGEEVMSSQDVERSHLKEIRTLQSAVLICVLQVWEGTKTAKKRIRQRRYSSVVRVSHIPL